MVVALAAILKSALILCVLAGSGIALARRTLLRPDAEPVRVLLKTQQYTIATTAVISLLTISFLAYRLSGSFDPSIVWIVANSPSGYAVGFVVVGALIGQSRRLAAIGALLIVAAFAIVGHAPARSTIDGIVVGVHVAACAWWTGGLLILSASFRKHGHRVLADLLQRFSRQAVPIVLLLVVTGSWTALQLLGFSISALSTDYGFVLLTKISLAMSALSIAIYNRLMLAPRVNRGDAGACRRLAVTIAIELTLIGFIAVATSILTSAFSPPVMSGQLN